VLTLALSTIKLGHSKKLEILLRESLARPVSLDSRFKKPKKSKAKKSRLKKNENDTESSNMAFILSELPPEIVLRVLLFVDLADLLVVSTLNKSFAQSMQDDQFWNSYCERNKIISFAHSAKINNLKKKLKNCYTTPFKVDVRDAFRNWSGRNGWHLQFEMLNAYEFGNVESCADRPIPTLFVTCIDVSRFDQELDGQNYLQKCLAVVQRFVKCNRDKEAETQKRSHGIMVVLTRVAKFKEKIASGVEFKQYFEEGPSANDSTTILDFLETKFADVSQLGLVKRKNGPFGLCSFTFDGVWTLRDDAFTKDLTEEFFLRFILPSVCK
jgi:hypothetical protein